MMEEYDIDVLCLQETKVPENAIRMYENHIAIFSSDIMERPHDQHPNNQPKGKGKNKAKEMAERRLLQLRTSALCRKLPQQW